MDVDFTFRKPIDVSVILSTLLDAGMRSSIEGREVAYLVDEDGMFEWRTAAGYQLNEVMRELGDPRWNDRVVGMTLFFAEAENWWRFPIPSWEGIHVLRGRHQPQTFPRLFSVLRHWVVFGESGAPIGTAWPVGNRSAGLSLAGCGPASTGVQVESGTYVNSVGGCGNAIMLDVQELSADEVRVYLTVICAS
ncbi:hypothetical protein ACF05L_28845 [Streptomyces bobili]|uniref:hypothetical protein n=1 Tax=Streptomyces bobili TaxID=67280 RepID=UPI0036F84C4B